MIIVAALVIVHTGEFSICTLLEYHLSPDKRRRASLRVLCVWRIGNRIPRSFTRTRELYQNSRAFTICRAFTRMWERLGKEGVLLSVTVLIVDDSPFARKLIRHHL